MVVIAQRVFRAELKSFEEKANSFSTQQSELERAAIAEQDAGCGNEEK
jgi:hypothetical protein